MSDRGFLPIPDAGRYRIEAVRVPRCLLAAADPSLPELPLLDVEVDGGRIVAVAVHGGGSGSTAGEHGSEPEAQGSAGRYAEARDSVGLDPHGGAGRPTAGPRSVEHQPSGSAGGSAAGAEPPCVQAGGCLLLPGFVDMHTHLDKGHIWPRRANPDGSFDGALAAVAEDRREYWSAEDVRARMTFALECAHAHGTVAIRTHLDSLPPQQHVSWPLFAEVRAEWAGRITLQAVSLFGIELVREHEVFRGLVDTVAAHDGVLGTVVYPLPDVESLLREVFRAAAERGLALDLHVDETLDPEVRTLDRVARLAKEFALPAPVVAGHCCSLATQPEADALATLDRVADAGMAIVSLPMCNLYLQDRRGGRTPRYRGLTLVHEMRARGIDVCFASDNTRDPFYAFGDLDMLEVLREATRIGHLDHPLGDWPAAFTRTPAKVLGLTERGVLAPGAPADFALFRARSVNELLARPHADRTVVRGGRAIERTLPGYEALDAVLGHPGAR